MKLSSLHLQAPKPPTLILLAPIFLPTDAFATLFPLRWSPSFLLTSPEDFFLLLLFLQQQPPGPQSLVVHCARSPKALISAAKGALFFLDEREREVESKCCGTCPGKVFCSFFLFLYFGSIDCTRDMSRKFSAGFRFLCS